MTENTRTFISIGFPDEVIKEITRIQSVLESKKFTGKIIEPENLHLTLKFLGEIDDEMLSKVKKALSTIKFPKFEASLTGAGTFSYRKSPRIVWVHVKGKGFDLQKSIDNVLRNFFPKEDRFMSHLTIARVKHVSDKEAFKDYVKNLGVKQIKFPVESFNLMSSELNPLGPIYKTIKKYKLK